MSNKRKKQAEPAPPVPCVLSIEEESQRLLQVSEATREEMDSFFPALLNQDIPAGEVQGKVDSLRRASANITRALTQTYALTDEFGARWKDIKKQKKKATKKKLIDEELILISKGLKLDIGYLTKKRLKH